MQKISVALLLSFLLIGVAFSAKITQASYDSKKDELVLSVYYGGGCKEHTFTLDFSDVCLETMPAQCSAKLIQKVDGIDPCEAIMSKELRFSLKNFSNRPAFLTVTNNNSKVKVFIPEKE